MVTYHFFGKWHPSTILDSSDAHWDHPQTVVAGFYCYVIFIDAVVGFNILCVWLENAIFMPPK